MAQAWRRPTAGLAAYLGGFRYGATHHTGTTHVGLPSMLPSQGPTPRWSLGSATDHAIDLSQHGLDDAFGSSYGFLVNPSPWRQARKPAE